MLFYCTVGMIKVSITLFNRRLTGLTSRRWSIAHYTFLSLLLAYIVVSVFLQIFKCNPPAKQYSMITFGQVRGPITCMNRHTVGITLSALHVAFDFALLAVPLIVLYHVQLSWSKKLRLGLLFSIGSVSCIASVMRHRVQVKANRQPDLTCE